MTITLYRSDRSLWSRSQAWGDAPILAWQEYTFHPQGFAQSSGESFRKLRLASVPVRVVVPFGSKVVGEGKAARLRGHFGELSAESVYYLAKRGEKGMRIDGSRDENPVVRSHV